MNAPLEAHQQDRLLRLTLNRPEKRNALSIELCCDLVSALERAAADPSIGAVLLTGSGKSFCAGMDLTEALSADPSEVNRVQTQLFMIGARLRLPIVAAVQGAALGGGTALAANCHVVLAAEDAQFGLTEIRIGLWPFLVFRAVADAIGERRTVELSLTGRKVGAVEACQIGLAHQVFPADQLVDRAVEIATAVAASSPDAVRSGLAFVQEARGRGAHDAIELGARARDRLIAGPGFREGVRAFQDKRRPDWPPLRVGPK
jgi:enoyl-CoA hydratase/carnithine racemase